MKRRFLAMLLSLLMVFAMLPVSAFAADNEDADTPAGNADTTPSLQLTFYGDGAKGNTAINKDDCERDTMWARATGLDSSKPYRMTITAPANKSFASAEGDEFVGTGNTEKVFGGWDSLADDKTSVGYYFSLKRWTGSEAFGADINGDDLSGTYTVKLYEGTAAATAAEEGEEVKEAETEFSYTNVVATATIDIEQVTVDFGAAASGDTKTAKDLIYQHEDKKGDYFFTEVTSNKRTATFYADAADLTAKEKETDRSMLLRLISFKGTDSADANAFPDGTGGKEWRYDAESKTFTYADVVTIKKATESDSNVEVPTDSVLKANNETFEVSVTANYLPKADNVDFTLKTAGDTTKKAVWTGKITDATKITGSEVSVSATEAISVTAGTGVTLPDANVVTASDATTKVAMFEITPASGENTKATATITVTSDRQPVTVPADFGTFTKDTGTGTEANTWILVKEDATAAAITVNQEAAVDEIADLKATATRGTAAADGKVPITLDVADADGEEVTFKYKVFSEEPTKPEVTANASTGYLDYPEDGFEYTDGNDYVAVATVNGSGEITAWGLAVIPKEEPKADTAVEVEKVDGKDTVKADADKKEVDTALEAAIQTEESDEPVTATLDFSKKEDGSTVSADVVEVGIPAESLDKVVEHNAVENATPVSVEVKTPAGDVVANPDVLTAIQETEVKDVPTDADSVETKVVLSIKKDTVTEGTTDVPKTEAESFNIEFKKVTTYTPAGGGDPETKTATVEVKTEVTVTVPTSVEPKAGNTLFAYFMKAADKLFYVGTATKEGTRATFTAPHLSTYVLYAEKVPGDIGVSRVISETEEGTVQETIIFDENREHTINLEEGETSVTLNIPSTIDLTCEASDDGTYNSKTGVFALKSGKTSATLTFTEGEGDDAITYTLILNAATTGDDEETKTPVTEDGKITIDGVEGDSITFTPGSGQSTASVPVSDAGSTVSFYVGTVKSATLNGTTYTVPANGMVTLTSVKPGDKFEFTASDGTKYVMNFTPDTTSDANLEVTAEAISAGDGEYPHQKLKVKTPRANHRYVFKVEFKSAADSELGVFTMTAGEDGSVIVKTDPIGYKVSVYEFSGTNDMIVNGSVTSTNQTGANGNQNVTVTGK